MMGLDGRVTASKYAQLGILHVMKLIYSTDLSVVCGLNCGLNFSCQVSVAWLQIRYLLSAHFGR